MQDQGEIQILPRPEENGVAARTLARGGALQQVRSSYATAIYVQKPRELADVQRRLLEEARLAGTDFYYGWGKGKDAVEGKSVQLAMAAARCWGNCAVETQPVQDMPDSWIFTAAFVDLETGFTLSRQFRQSKKWMVYGKFDDERKDDIRFQIGQSKALRNVVLDALPETILRRALDEAKAGVRAAVEDYVKKNSMVKAVDAIIVALGKFGIKEELILERLGRADRAGIDVDDLVILRGNLVAIDNGQERAEVLFPSKEQKAPSSEISDRASEILAKAGVKKPEPSPVGTQSPAQPAGPGSAPTGAPPGKPNIEDVERDDMVARLKEQIDRFHTIVDGQEVGAELVKNHDFLGDANYKILLAALQEKNRTIEAAGKQAQAEKPKQRKQW
jgi:hypothetical protein